ncbi:protein kinase [Kribbella sp. NPDC051718]|uniref:serine/threonine-protein kinase n=1 Tax=Kribbella sp. NPDC051718 TaxID=3155168 RepID=UPI0034395C9A
MTDRPATRHEAADGKPATRHEPADGAKPSTRHEAPDGTKPAIRHEAAEDGRPATRHEASEGGRPATRHEAAGGPVRPAARRRFVMPDAVDREYRYEEDLSSGGTQADVVLCTDLKTGGAVAIKIYRPEAAATLKDEAISRLSKAHRDHVLPFRLDRDEYQIWEVQEYCPLGSLEDLALRRGGGAQDPAFVWAVVHEVGEALDHIHGLDIAHRDLKPQNILIRREDPLDCVLADFGLATVSVLSNAIGSVAGTYTYTSPEGSVGRGNKANDWWGLGIIAHELLTGRHLHSSPGGDGMLSELRVRAAFLEQTWSYDDVTDPRWRLLLDGLLAPAAGRWTWTQVKEWLEGGTPEVGARWPSGAPTSQRRRRAYHFAGVECLDPESLAAAIRENFTIATDHLAGVRVIDLKKWLHDTPVETAADDVLEAVRAGHSTPARAAVELQVLLDPGHEPGFRGRELSMAGLATAIQAAKTGDQAAIGWIRELRRSSVMSIVGHHAEEPRLSRADELLVIWWRQVDSGQLRSGLLAAPQLKEFVDNAQQTMEGTLLEAALNDRTRRQMWSRARELATLVPAAAGTWIPPRPVALPPEIDLDVFPQAALLMLVVSPWLDRIAEQQKEVARVAAAARAKQEAAAAEAKRQQDEREAAQARRQQQILEDRRKNRDFSALMIGFGVCITVIVPWLLGHNLLRDRWPRREAAGVFESEARDAGAYFLTDWVTGCLVVAVLVAAFILVRPWRKRTSTLVVAAVLLGSTWWWGKPFVEQEWNRQEQATIRALRSTPYPFEKHYSSCGKASVTFTSKQVDRTKPDVVYTLFAANTRSNTAGRCNMLEFYEGWRRAKTIVLPTGVYIDGSISAPISATRRTAPAKTMFTVRLEKSKKLSYSLPALLKAG